jgi:hypothetical protein
VGRALVMRTPILHALACVVFISCGAIVESKIAALLFGISAGLQIGLAIFTFGRREGRSS